MLAYPREDGQPLLLPLLKTIILQLRYLSQVEEVIDMVWSRKETLKTVHFSLFKSMWLEDDGLNVRESEDIGYKRFEALLPKLKHEKWTENGITIRWEIED